MLIALVNTFVFTFMTIVLALQQDSNNNYLCSEHAGIMLCVIVCAGLVVLNALCFIHCVCLHWEDE